MIVALVFCRVSHDWQVVLGVSICEKTDGVSPRGSERKERLAVVEVRGKKSSLKGC